MPVRARTPGFNDGQHDRINSGRCERDQDAGHDKPRQDDRIVRNADVAAEDHAGAPAFVRLAIVIGKGRNRQNRRKIRQQREYCRRCERKDKAGARPFPAATDGQVAHHKPYGRKPENEHGADQDSGGDETRKNDADVCTGNAADFLLAGDAAVHLGESADHMDRELRKERKQHEQKQSKAPPKSAWFWARFQARRFGAHLGAYGGLPSNSGLRDFKLPTRPHRAARDHL